MTRGRPPKPAWERFWAKVDLSHNTDDCWEWLGFIPTGSAYGRFNHGRDQAAHRVAWILANGPIPEGLEIDHLCQNPPCADPTHLEPVTPAENMRRRAVAKTHCKQGHEFTEENTYRQNGVKRCRECHRRWNREFWQREAAQGRRRVR